MKSSEFFDIVRPMFPGARLSSRQVNGLLFISNDILDLPVPYQAYILATTFLETARTMEPIKEYGSDARFRRLYDIEGSRPEKARELGNLYPGDGVKFCGRGYVQLTGRNNYTKGGEKLGVDLVGSPHLAMRPEIAVKLLRVGMLEGWFTGKKLSDYLDQEIPDYVEARRIINGKDRAQEIAKYARRFELALRAEDRAPTPAEPKQTFWQRLRKAWGF